ncbi:MAG: hypothetical protein DRH79_03025 [Candidatus Cloacimonadota bacterium]|nr:MAG: hypothetical protein DRH79_03025 [Candidatus Cloacimonadota bacterium]
MTIMKKTILVLFVLSSLFIFAQDETDNQAEANTQLIDLVREEGRQLAYMEEEVSYFFNLLKQQQAIRELYENDKLADILKHYAKYTKQFDRMFEQNDLETLSTKIGEHRVIYGKIPELHDQIRFYQAKLFFYRGQYARARNYLEDMIRNYPQSSKIEEAQFMLQKVYFYEGYDQELITLFDSYTGEMSITQNYWLAQAYFNVGRYDEAAEIFNILKQDTYYSYKAASMLAMISYFKGEVDSAIEEFLALSDNDYKKNNPDYDFSFLALARLYTLEKDEVKALQYYNTYCKMQKEPIDDAVLFEVASRYNENGMYDQALTYLEQIVEKPHKSQYYTSAKFLIAMNKSGGVDLDLIESSVSEMISQNDMLLSTLNTKYQLLEDYSRIRRIMAASRLSQSELDELSLQLTQIEADLQATNETMQGFYEGMDPTTLNTLILLEEEYKTYTSTVSDIDALVLLANSTPNDRIPRLMEEEIAYSDSAIFVLQTLKYLGHRTQVSGFEFDMARRLAIEKMYAETDMNTWNELQVIAQDNNHTDIAEKIARYKELVTANMESFDLIADYMFGGTPTDEFKQAIEAEIASIEASKTEMIGLKDVVRQDFNKRIAAKLNREKQILISEFDSLKDLYDRTLSAVIGDVAAVTDQYQMKLLGLLFKQTQTMDKKYKELQEKVRNE